MEKPVSAVLSKHGVLPRAPVNPDMFACPIRWLTNVGGPGPVKQVVSRKADHSLSRITRSRGSVMS